MPTASMVTGSLKATKAAQGTSSIIYCLSSYRSYVLATHPDICAKLLPAWMNMAQSHPGSTTCDLWKVCLGCVADCIWTWVGCTWADFWHFWFLTSFEAVVWLIPVYFHAFEFASQCGCQLMTIRMAGKDLGVFFCLSHCPHIAKFMVCANVSYSFLSLLFFSFLLFNLSCP